MRIIQSKQLKCQIFYSILTSFGKFGHLSDPHIYCFHNFPNRLDDYKGPENMNYTIVKHGETFYGLHAAITSAVVQMNIL